MPSTFWGKDMPQYIVSARKYRPDSFGTLVGQDNIARTLKNSIQRGQLAHAYLFCGPRGVGKTTVARIFAKVINCYNPSADFEPCCQCESCVSFQEGRSYCIHELDAASNNSVDDIRTLIDQVNVPPQTGRYSVFIIDEVHMLSAAAFNAFLKTLEEPPEHAIFILATTEKHKILPTILSRCQTYDFNRISVPSISGHLRKIAALEGVTIDDESIHVIALKADGAMRDALTIFDQTVAFCGNEVKYADVVHNLNMLDYDNCFQMVDAFLTGDYEAALLKFGDILSSGFNALYFVTALSSHLRDLVVARSGGLDSLLELPASLKAKYKEQASRCTLGFLFQALSITTQCEAGYRASVNPRLHIEFALMRLSALSGQGPAAEAAIGQMQPKTVASSKPAPLASPAQKGPASPPAPAEAPSSRARRHSSSATSALSVGPSHGSSSASTPQKAPEISAEVVPDDASVQEKWNEIALEYKSRPRLATALAAYPLGIKEADGKKEATLFVENEGQKGWIEGRLLGELEGRLMQKAGSSALRLRIEVIPAEEKAKGIFTPREKAQKLMEGNPEVRGLVSDLELDI